MAPDQQMQQAQQAMMGGQGETPMPPLTTDGYNAAIDPDVLDKLNRLGDKEIVNASILAYMMDTPDVRVVAAKYIDDIMRGINGLARTLLLVEVQRSTFEGQVGEKQLSSFISRGKNILNRLTDFSIDIAMIN